MKLFVTAKFKADENKADIEGLCEIARQAGFEDFCFIRDVEKYQRGVFATPHALMDKAKAELMRCDALLIDLSESSSGGRIIEAGMAFAHDKSVIVIAKRGTQIGVPISGIASIVIEYDNVEDIVEPLQQFRESMQQHSTAPA